LLSPQTTMSQKLSDQTAVLKIIDDLIVQLPSRMDSLLDLRLALVDGSNPGRCVSLYFDLVETVTGWPAKELGKIRALLEERIQIEITVVETQVRSTACLNLMGSRRLEDYCQDTMREHAMKFTKAESIEMNFAWLS